MREGFNSLMDVQFVVCKSFLKIATRLLARKTQPPIAACPFRPENGLFRPDANIEPIRLGNTSMSLPEQRESTTDSVSC